MPTVILMTAIACQSTTEITVEKTKTTSPILLNNIQVQMHPNTNLGAIFTAQTDEEFALQIEMSHASLKPWRSLPSSIGNNHEIEVLGLRANESYQFTPIVISDEDEYTLDPIEFTSGQLPIDFPEYEFFSSSETSPGITLFGLSMDNYYGIGVDEEGEIVWYQSDPNIESISIDRQIKPLGNNHFLSMTRNGFREILANGDTVVEMPLSNGDDFRIHHDAIKLPNGNYLGLSRENMPVDLPQLGGEANLRGDKIIEIQENGEVIWTWSSFEHLDTTRFPSNLSLNTSPNANNRIDWSHANGLNFNAAENTLLLTVRHQHWIINIDKDSGEVNWRLGKDGDFTLLEGDWFYAPHNATWLDSDTVLLYDNGNERPEEEGGEYSRAVIYDLNVNDMTATVAWDFAVPHFTERLGGVTPLPNGHFLICAGGTGRAVNAPAQLLEVNPETNEVVWQLTAADQAIYRAYRIHGFGE